MSKQDVVCVFKYVGVIGVIVLTVTLYAPANSKPLSAKDGDQDTAVDTVVDSAV